MATMRRLPLVLALLVLAGCTSTGDGTGGVVRTTEISAAAELVGGTTGVVVPDRLLDAPSADAPLPAATRQAVEALAAHPLLLDVAVLEGISTDDDVRAAWVLADLLRFHQGGEDADVLTAALARLTGLGPDVSWVVATDVLLAADVPAFPGYLDLKRTVHLAVEPAWAPFFTADSDLDWRHVAWGGVYRDAIPHLNDPALEDAGSDWIPDDEVVLGLLVDGDARAYPRRVMEVHEMVNDTVGGQRIALPYCTLCGAAIAYRTDGVVGEEPLELRTSGLLQRSNKLMYDAGTESLLGQFLGVGLSGPLRGEALERLPIVTTTWGEWRTAHPETTVVARDARPRDYDPDPLRGRDDDGPIFPIGRRDDRLGVQEPVLGVELPQGVAVAFVVGAATEELRDGGSVEESGVAVELRDDGGLVVVDVATGRELPSHQAFWFAWSQFRPDTLLWEG